MSDPVTVAAACGVTFLHDPHGYHDDDGRTRVCDGEPPVDAAHFTLEEAQSTVAGEVRGIILWEIASRCGQVPDLHPRLLNGIEAAARIIATRVTPSGEAE